MQAAIAVFNLFPGIWKVAVMETNDPVQIFWRKVIARYTHNKYQEVREPEWDGPIQTFTAE